MHYILSYVTFWFNSIDNVTGLSIQIVVQNPHNAPLYIAVLLQLSQLLMPHFSHLRFSEHRHTLYGQNLIKFSLFSTVYFPVYLQPGLVRTWRDTKGHKVNAPHKRTAGVVRIYTFLRRNTPWHLHTPAQNNALAIITLCSRSRALTSTSAPCVRGRFIALRKWETMNSCRAKNVSF